MIAASGLVQLVLLLFCLWLAQTLGNSVISRFSLDEETDRLERMLFALGLGLGIIAYATLLLGTLQLYYRWIFVLLVVLTTAGYFFQSLRKRRTPAMATPAARWNWGGGKVERLFGKISLGLATLFSLIYLLAALAPETGFDALNYHLGVPRLYLAHHGMYHVSNIVYANYPFTVEMIYTFAWLLDSQLLAKLFNFAFGILAAAALVVLCRKYFTLPAGCLAALIFLSSPSVGFLFGTAYVDLGLALFVFLSFFAFYNWVRRPALPWLVLSGVFAGLSMGTKYLGLLAVVLVTAAMIFNWTRVEKPIRSLTILYSIAFLVVAPWLIKNMVLVGNPVSPILSDVFYNPDYYLSSDYRGLVRFTQSWRTYEGNLWDFLGSPWLLTFQGDLFGGSPGSVFLIFFPPAVLLGWRNRPILLLAGCSSVGYLFLILSTRLVRYFVPLFPLLSLVIAASLLSRGFRYARSVQAIATAALILLSLWQLPPAESFRLFTSEEERREYLAQRLGGADTLELHDFLENEIPARSNVLALTAGYQSMMDQALFMTPNCSPASELTTQILDISLARAGLSTIRLQPAEEGMHRYWKVILSGSAAQWPDDTYRPLFFFGEGESPLEVGLRRIHRSRTGEQLELTCDLGSARRVTTITYWGPNPSEGEVMLVVLEDADGMNGKEIRAGIEVRAPGSTTLNELVELFRRYEISYLFYPETPELSFIHHFFQNPDARKFFQPLRKIGHYDLIGVNP